MKPNISSPHTKKTTRHNHTKSRQTVTKNKKLVRQAYPLSFAMLILLLFLISGNYSRPLNLEQNLNTINKQSQRITETNTYIPHKYKSEDFSDSISGEIPRMVLGGVFLSLFLLTIVQFFVRKCLGKMVISTFVRFYQLLQLFAVYLYLPVVWKGNLLDSLIGFYQIGEFARLGSPILVQESGLNTVATNYWGKFTIYQTPRYLNIALPITSLALISISVLHGLIFIIQKIMKKSPKMVEVLHLFSNLKWFLLEMTFIRVTFQCMVGVSELWKGGAWSDLKTDTIIDRAFTVMIIITILGNYGYISLRISTFNKKITRNQVFNSNLDSKTLRLAKFDQFLGEDYLNTFFVNKNFKPRTSINLVKLINFLNLFDRYKNLLIIGIIVFAQNIPLICLGLCVFFQIAYICLLIICHVKAKKTPSNGLFQTKVDLVACWTSQTVNLILLAGGFALEPFEKDKISEFDSTDSGGILMLILLALIGLLIIVELIRAIFKFAYFSKHKDKNLYKAPHDRSSIIYPKKISRRRNTFKSAIPKSNFKRNAQLRKSIQISSPKKSQRRRVNTVYGSPSRGLSKYVDQSSIERWKKMANRRNAQEKIFGGHIERNHKRKMSRARMKSQIHNRKPVRKIMLSPIKMKRVNTEN